MANSIQEKLKDLQQQAEENSLFSSNANSVLKKYIEYGKESLDDIEVGKDFFIAVAFLNAQAKSSKIEHFIRKKLQHNAVSSKEGRGDGEKDGKYYEYKISTTNKNRQINAIQIRSWQDVDYYLLGYIDELNFAESRLYCIPMEDMVDLCKKYGRATHGTENINETNKHVEMSVRIKMKTDNDLLKLVETKYRKLEFENTVFN
jgi:hypothetical protein